jgi:hypothetical protein
MCQSRPIREFLPSGWALRINSLQLYQRQLAKEFARSNQGRVSRTRCEYTRARGVLVGRTYGVGKREELRENRASAAWLVSRRVTKSIGACYAGCVEQSEGVATHVLSFAFFRFWMNFKPTSVVVSAVSPAESCSPAWREEYTVSTGVHGGRGIIAGGLGVQAGGFGVSGSVCDAGRVRRRARG